MTMQQRPNNPIAQRKADVRRYSRNAAVSVGVGVIGGVALWGLTGGLGYLIIGLIIAVAGGWYNWNKVQQIVNHKDNY